jgi:hypothetical protein
LARRPEQHAASGLVSVASTRSPVHQRIKAAAIVLPHQFDYFDSRTEFESTVLTVTFVEPEMVARMRNNPSNVSTRRRGPCRPLLEGARFTLDDDELLIMTAIAMGRMEEIALTEGGRELLEGLIRKGMLSRGH